MRKSIKRRIAVLAVAIGLSGAIGMTAAGATKPNPEHKVTLCHRTASRTNPYVEVTVDVASVLGPHGHDGHNGPVFSPGLAKNVKWGDIIPAFDFGPGEQYAGKNLPAGAAILEGGCAVVTENTTTTEATTSTSTSTSTTTSTSSTTTTTRPASTTTTTHPTTTSSSTTTTTQPSGGRGDLFQVELRRCTQIHEGYRDFPGGTVVRWKVLVNDVKAATGHFVAEPGHDYHFLTQLLGTRLPASPQQADVHYYWTIGGVDFSYFVRRAPGCSGTSRLGVSGSGNFFVVELRNCTRLHVGYQFFPKYVRVTWVVTQGSKGRVGYFWVSPGNQYHFLNRSLRMELDPDRKARVTFYWHTGITNWHYSIVRGTSC